MKGFFSIKETQSKSRPDGKTYSCVSCGLLKHVSSPVMEPYGEFKKDILIVYDYPAKSDDERNMPLTDKYGRKIKKVLSKFGIDAYRDCLITQSMRCHAGSRKGNLSYEIACCRKFLLKTIDEHQPKLILLFGQTPLISLIGHRFKKDIGSIHKWRGFTIPDQDFKTWVCPVLDPQFVDQRESEVQLIWEQDIAQALEKIEEKFPKWKQPNIEIIDDLSVLREIKSEQIAIDYETTGIKPHAPGHRIVCAAVADSPDHAYTFIMPKTRKERQPFIDLLENPMIGKLAQNMKFEDNWTTVRLKTQIKGWEFDSMLAAHILDNREGITGLKFQTYIQFGVVDYSSEVDPYLKGAVANDSNSLNRVLELIENPRGREQLLTYCGMDTITQYRLSMLQVDKLNYSFLPF